MTDETNWQKHQDTVVTDENAFDKDWTRKCENCDAQPVVMATGLCGPCTWGEADTAGGNW